MMRRACFVWGFTWCVGLTLAAGCAPSKGVTRVGLDLRAMGALTLDGNALVTDVSVAVTATDISQPLLWKLDPNDLTLETEIPSGPKRHFDVAVHSDTNIVAYGRAVSDLPSASHVDVDIQAYPAGLLQGTALFPTAAPVPDTYVILATAASPRQADLAETVIPIADGNFTAPLVAGTYAIKVFDNVAMKGTWVIDTQVVIVAGQVNTANLIVSASAALTPKLVFVEEPASSLVAGAPMPVTVQVVDSSNTLVADANLLVRLVLLASVDGAPLNSNAVTVTPPAGPPENGNVITAPSLIGEPAAATTGVVSDPNLALNGTLTLTTTQGVASFQDLLVRFAGTNYVLFALSQGLAAAASHPFTVTPGAATILALTLPQSAGLGASVTGTVQAADAFGNLDTNFSDTVHFTCTDPNATLPADTALTAGAATFTDAFSFVHVGTQGVTVDDTSKPALTAQQNVLVVPQPVF